MAPARVRMVGVCAVHAVAAAAFLAGCAGIRPIAAPAGTPPGARSGTAPSAGIARAPLPPANPRLPPVPQVDGALRIRVVYPRENALVTARDSNFIFGSVGTGAAGLRINGALVPVWPNGAFMGWLALPPASAPWYDITAYTASDTVHLRHPVRTLASVSTPARPAPVATRPTSPVPAELVAHPVTSLASDTDNVVIGRPSPVGNYQWFLFPGTRVRITEFQGDMARLQLDPDQQVWVSRGEVRELGADAGTGRLQVSAERLRAGPDQLTFSLHTPSPPAYIVQEEWLRTGRRDSAVRVLTLTLYNTTAPRKQLPTVRDPLLGSVGRSHVASRTVYRFELTRPVYGYLALYSRGEFTLSIRRPPVVDPASPLGGMTIVVDPGHPPIGATGPTGLWEPVATLAVGLRVREMLRARGARVVMTRITDAPVPLYDRPIIARRANANALVSIHLNADADGNNPFRTNGTGTYYFHPHSRALASDLERSLVPQLGLRDRGVFFQNIALGRPTWFPASLTEGLYIIMPDQEAAIRTPEYQEAYARGIVDGLEQYFRSLGRQGSISNSVSAHE